MPALLALLSSGLWGLTDFLGGTLSRRLPVASVLGLSQLAALLLLVPAAAATGALGAPTTYLLPGLCAGAVGVVSLGMFFRALATGTMGVVAPVAALGVVVPVVIGLVRGESPTSAQSGGIVLAVVGVVLASGPELGGRGRGRGGGAVPLLLALAAAAGFGTVLVLVASGSRGADGTVVMTLLTMRLAEVGLLAALWLATGARRGWSLRVGRADLPLLASLGLTDVAANAAYGVASRHALVSVTAVLASLYPVVTVLLAYRVLGERLGRIQVAGVLAALAGVALLAAA